MTHLTRERLLELGLDTRAELSTEERAHLGACPTCAAELALEQELTGAIETLPRVEPPADFVATTVSRLEEELARRHLRFTAATMLAALGCGLAAAAGLVLVLVTRAGAIVHDLIVGFDEVVVLGRAAVTVMAAMPAVPVALTLAACVAALGIAAGVGRVVLVAVEAK